jgi:hypothetical protein
LIKFLNPVDHHVTCRFELGPRSKIKQELTTFLLRFEKDGELIRVGSELLLKRVFKPVIERLKSIDSNKYVHINSLNLDLIWFSEKPNLEHP